MNQTLEQGTETAAPTGGEQPTQTAVDDTLELLESARADLAPGVFDRKPENEGAEATASEGEIETNPAPDSAARKPLPLEVQQSIDKRIGKEVSKRKELEEQLENERSVQRDLEEKLKAAKTAQAEPSIVIRSDDPYAGMSQAELDKKERTLVEFKAWAIRNEHGYVGSGEDNDPDWSEDEVRERRAQVEEELLIKIPEARQRLAKRQGVERRAVEKFPFLADKNLPGFEEAARLYNTKPFQELLKVDPSALVLLGHAARDIYAEKSGEGSISTNAQAAPPVVPTEAMPMGGPGPAAPARGRTTGLTKERAQAAANGNLEAVVGEMLGL